jgi:hypothetical protein
MVIEHPSACYTGLIQFLKRKMLNIVRVGFGYFAVMRATRYKLPELECVSITNNHFSIFNFQFLGSRIFPSAFIAD